MELRHLRYFVAVADEQNVTRAAEKLHIAQPAVSRQIRDLEEELGVALLERGAKSVRLTEAGRVFLKEAREVLQRAAQAVAKVRAAADDGTREIHVGYAPSLTALILPRALRQLQADLPGVRVHLHDLSTEQMLDGVREGKLQVALVVKPRAGSFRGLRFHEIERYAMCVAVPPGHPFIQGRALTLARVAAEPLIAYSIGEYPEYHAGLRALFAKAGHALKIIEEHDSVTSLIAAVEAGRGVAIVAASLRCMTGDRLQFIPLPKPAPEIAVGAMSRLGPTLPIVQKFIAAAAATKDPG